MNVFDFQNQSDKSAGLQSYNASHNSNNEYGSGGSERKNCQPKSNLNDFFVNSGLDFVKPGLGQDLADQFQTITLNEYQTDIGNFDNYDNRNVSFQIEKSQFHKGNSDGNIIESRRTQNKVYKQHGRQQRRQGYRHMWKKISKMGSASQGSAEFSDSVTVEDLMRRIQQVPAQQEVISWVEQSLYFFDSSALAALLKELSKQNFGYRAVEIFDWLRSLKPTHQLSFLCDIFTYTTMISQCGSLQQLHRALDLVKEMKQRNVPCNVHTYSALMSVCMKANEQDLALDVYRDMLNQGLKPNIVTYNTLIDIYGKKGDWKNAVNVVDQIESQGIQPEVRTYNTVINTCSRSGCSDEALKVFERMLKNGIQPSATTYTALISGCGKKGDLNKAIWLFHDSVARGCERNVITYSSLINACEKVGAWQKALQIFEWMHKEGCHANVVTYNSLIQACAQGDQWEKAWEMFQHMLSAHCIPDNTTYNAMFIAMQRGQQWRHALDIYHIMNNHGNRPDAVAFNMLLEVLWNTGMEVLQGKSVMLGKLAQHYGLFRIVNHGKEQHTSRFSVWCLTTGAAIVTLLAWFYKQRSYPGSITTPRLLFQFTREKQHRAEQPIQVIGEQIKIMLEGMRCPLRVTVTDNVTIKLEGLTSEFAPWLSQVWLIYHDGLPSNPGQQFASVPHEQLLQDEAGTSKRCSEAFKVVVTHQQGAHPENKTLDSEQLQIRSLVIKYIKQYSEELEVPKQSQQDAFLLLTRAMLNNFSATAAQAKAVALTCVRTSSNNAQQSARGQLLHSQLKEETACMDEVVASIKAALGGTMRCVSALRIVHLYQERLCEYLYPDMPSDQLPLYLQLLYAVTCEAGESPACISTMPTIVAAAAFIVVRQFLGLVPVWPASLEDLTGYTLKSPEIEAEMQNMLQLLLKLAAQRLSAGFASPQAHVASMVQSGGGGNIAPLDSGDGIGQNV